MASSGKKLSELVAHVQRYAHSGEINFKVNDSVDLFEKAKQKYSDGQLDILDGIKVSYPNWWFSLRASNTEPLVRLNLEADTPDLMEEMKYELIALITASK